MVLVSCARSPETILLYFSEARYQEKYLMKNHHQHCVMDFHKQNIRGDELLALRDAFMEFTLAEQLYLKL
ncbi:uncharacterized protein PHALS_11997 [Plasmopara halstedii]|uniref:Uncharacterized protein n=1 Tax=Plasmopara halstedii TaxID=4781 RepID=A0A0P1A649_PLAHL|nr:uncharacterized protein PHALS_11997 [Plasmopara halstedii]CEG35673.1 hypothetical protein PHALS_11997 [Plasmopara halstedii]|eukprot:XP_024572042.1 hypothetical protein PHALS_11997 [Plasmopara halstedii]